MGISSSKELGEYAAHVGIIDASNTRNLDVLRAKIDHLMTSPMSSSPEAMSAVKGQGQWMDACDLAAVESAYVHQLGEFKREIEESISQQEKPADKITDSFMHRAVLAVMAVWPQGETV